MYAKEHQRNALVVVVVVTNGGRYMAEHIPTISLAIQPSWEILQHGLW